jgi:hypothetical protein
MRAAVAAAAAALLRLVSLMGRLWLWNFRETDSWMENVRKRINKFESETSKVHRYFVFVNKEPS